MNNRTTTLVKFISDGDRAIYDVVNYVFIITAICIFGVVANVINIVVFYKQGFNNTMNISFFGLAISDLCGLLTLLWLDLCVNPLFVDSVTTMVPSEIQYLTGGAPHTCFARITSWITVFITAERCLCISIPVKIKQLITRKRTFAIICIIYIVIIASFLPEYVTSYIGWKFYADRNQTLLGLAFTSNRKDAAGLIFFLYAILGSASFIAVIMFTAFLVALLKQKSKRHKEANLGTARSEIISARDSKTMNMVVMVATVLIVCYTPGVAVSMVTFFESEFSIDGVYVNAFFVLWSFVFIFEALNSSVNIFLYYSMSTKYRETFCQIFKLETAKTSS